MNTANTGGNRESASRRLYRDWWARHGQHRLKAAFAGVMDLYLLSEAIGSSYSVPCRFMHDRHGIVLLGPGRWTGSRGKWDSVQPIP